MSFNEAQYRAAVEQVQTKHQELGNRIGQIMPAAIDAASPWYIPEPVKDAIIWCGEKLVELARWIFDKIVECLKGVAMPILMFQYAWDWQDVRGAASTVAGEVSPEALSAGERWRGPSARAYQERAVPPQSAAATQIESIAETTATSLTVCAAAGLAFYVAIGVILVKFLVALVGAIVALGSVVFSWAGLLLVIEEAGVNTGLIIAAVTALTAALGAQASQMSTLHGAAQDNSSFPGGQWPDPATAGSYPDPGGWRVEG